MLDLDRADRAAAKVDALIEIEPAPDEATGARHPFAQIVPHSRKIPAVEYVLTGFIQEGVVTIAGARGIGKTSALVPIACIAAGFHRLNQPLAPKAERWRHVVYIAEDTKQADRIIRAYCHYLNMPDLDAPPSVGIEQIRERVHLVEAKRLDPLDAVSVGWHLRKRFSRFMDGVEILPLVVFDTLSAAFDLENENDNTEAARLVAALMQDFEGFPVWLVSHVAKAQEHNNKAPTMRGGGALEGNTVQNLYLVADIEGKKTKRYLQRGKTRFETDIGALEMEPHIYEAEAVNRWGEVEPASLICAIPHPCKDGIAASPKAEEENQAQKLAEISQAVIEKIRYAQEQGIIANKEWLKRGAGIGAKVQAIVDAINQLLAERVIQSVEIPKEERPSPQTKTRLVITTPEQQQALRAALAETAPEVEKSPLEPVGMDGNAPPIFGATTTPKRRHSSHSRTHSPYRVGTAGMDRMGLKCPHPLIPRFIHSRNAGNGWEWMGMAGTTKSQIHPLEHPHHP